MNEYKFTLTVQANTEEEAKKVAISLNNLYKNVENEDLIKLSEAVVKKPSLVKTALKYLKFA